MGVLDQVTDLKNQGMADGKIVSTLREQGISPKQINDALNQAKIKSAVSSSGQSDEMEPSIMPAPQNPNVQQGSSDTDSDGADLSNEDLTPPPTYSNIPSAAQKSFGRMTKEADEDEENSQGEYVPQPGDQGQYYMPFPGQGQNSYANQNQGYAPASQSYEYQPSSEGASAGGVDSDTMIEIAEQVFSEKSKPIQKNIDDLTEISTLIQSKIENFADRLKRIESTIDSLQHAVLDKIGSYGSNLESIKKEMGMMQDSFGKIVNTALDHAEHKHTATHQHSTLHQPTVHTEKKTTTVIHKSSPKTKAHTKKKKSSGKK